MAHVSKKSTDANIIKTFKLKIYDFDFKLDDLLDQFIKGYNNVGSWLNQNLTKTVGEVLLQYLNPKKPKKSEDREDPKYLTDCVKKKDMSLAQYLIFGSPTNVLNSIYNVISETNLDQYDGNCCKIATAYFRKNGYVKSVVANYQSSLSRLKPNVKYATVDSSSSLNDKITQCCFELTKHDGIDTIEGWEMYLDYLQNKRQTKVNVLDRMLLLFEVFKEHTDEVWENYNNMLNCRLSTYNGCVRNNTKKSLTITGCKNFLKIKPNSTHYGYDVFISCGKSDRMCMSLMGNKQLTKLENGVRTELTTILDKTCDCLTLTKSNGNYYAHISCYCDFKKIQTPINKVVGVDVNTKHSLLATSIIDDGNVDGYVNIYKELLADDGFRSTIGNNKILLKIYEDLSKSVNFCPIEVEFLYTRVQTLDDKRKANEIERAISNVLDKLQERYRKSGDTKKRKYIEFTKNLRSKIVSYFKVYNKYSALQQKFDSEQCYVDESTKSKETMDKRRFENPFNNTTQAQELLGKLKNIEIDIIGCRNNIIQYANEIFIANGYDTINLENLTSSSFEKYKPIPVPTTVLDKYGWKGMTLEEVKSTKLYQEKGDNYNIVGDTIVEDVSFTPLGEYNYYLSLFYNVVIKKVHFAEIKDRFVLLSNNSGMNVCIVPPFYTSQIDSQDHKLFVDEKGAVVEKNKVRRSQERFINQLNADYNAACNIAYPSLDKEWRKAIFGASNPQYKYSTPTMESSIRTQYVALDRIKKMGATKQYEQQQ